MAACCIGVLKKIFNYPSFLTFSETVRSHQKRMNSGCFTILRIQNTNFLFYHQSCRNRKFNQKSANKTLITTKVTPNYFARRENFLGKIPQSHLHSKTVSCISLSAQRLPFIKSTAWRLLCPGSFFLNCNEMGRNMYTIQI